MDQQGTPQQVLIEHQMLNHITSALKATMHWEYQGTDFSRKLSSLRFVAQSFQRHLKRLMALEEVDGYLAVVLESRPQLNQEIEALRQEHDQFRHALPRIMGRLQRVSPTNRESITKILDELTALLEKLDAHGRKETSMLQEALLTDEGGEG